MHQQNLTLGEYHSCGMLSALLYGIVDISLPPIRTKKKISLRPTCGQGEGYVNNILQLDVTYTISFLRQLRNICMWQSFDHTYGMVYGWPGTHHYTQQNYSKPGDWRFGLASVFLTGTGLIPGPFQHVYCSRRVILKSSPQWCWNQAHVGVG